MPQSNLEICLGISGTFEGGGGGARWNLTSGNFDGMGISVGCLQWNPGTGSIQKLLSLSFQGMNECPEEFMPIHALMSMKPKTAVSYAIDQWIDPLSIKKNMTAEAKSLWQAFLSTEACMNAQKALAGAILDKAIDEAHGFLPWLEEIDLRTMAFFFDLRVQQGGMVKRMDDGTYQSPEVLNDPSEAVTQPAIDFAIASGKSKTAAAWAEVVEKDELAKVLLHYAYARAMTSREAYRWDTLSRRGTIACRCGLVHGAWIPLNAILP